MYVASFRTEGGGETKATAVEKRDQISEFFTPPPSEIVSKFERFTLVHYEPCN